MRGPNILILAHLLFVIATGKAGDKQPANYITKYFSTNYSEARQKFLDAACYTGAALELFQNSHTVPNGERLYTDVALLGPKDANTFLVLLSGTHGVEGFAGSAIQNFLLSRGAIELPPDTGLLFVHAVNPYGFASLRRCNEDNVDLNRNFINHFKSYPPNAGYNELADAINPKSLSIWDNAKSSLKFFWYALKNGRKALKRAISSGQYTHPQGLFYGGRQEAWSSNTLKSIANKYLGSAKRVVIIDIHTGLGRYGDAEVIMNEPSHSPAYKRAVSWWGKRVRTTANGSSVSTHLQASLKITWPILLPNAEVTAVSLEFGTLSTFKVFWALRNENWLHQHGSNDHPRAAEIKEDLLRAFYPDNYDWYSQVLESGKSLVSKVLLHLS